MADLAGDTYNLLRCRDDDEPFWAGASRQRNQFLTTKMVPLTIRRSSTLGISCDSGKYGSVRHICASDSKTRSPMKAPPDTPIEPSGRYLHKQFNGS